MSILLQYWKATPLICGAIALIFAYTLHSSWPYQHLCHFHHSARTVNPQPIVKYSFTYFVYFVYDRLPYTRMSIHRGDLVSLVPVGVFGDVPGDAREVVWVLRLVSCRCSPSWTWRDATWYYVVCTWLNIIERNSENMDSKGKNTICELIESVIHKAIVSKDIIMRPKIDALGRWAVRLQPARSTHDVALLLPWNCQRSAEGKEKEQSMEKMSSLYSMESHK